MATSLVQGSPLRVFHAGLPYSSSPFVVGPMKVCNKLKLDPVLSNFATSVTALQLNKHYIVNNNIVVVYTNRKWDITQKVWLGTMISKCREFT